jgi:hypothetical protein
VTLIAPWISAVTHHPAVAAVQQKQIIVSEPGAITAVHESDTAARLVHSLSCDEGEDRSDVKKQLLESSGLSASALRIHLTLSESRLAAGASARLLDLVEIEK